jgi:glyoxylase-like metal-dependent hydrolase (beta-lactamase superfamily II)
VAAELVVSLRDRRLVDMAHLFLVEHGGVLTLIDTGAVGTAPRIFDALERTGRRPEDLRQIVLTHAHGDHAGEARAIRDVTGARIVIGAADAPVFRGVEEYPFGRGMLAPLYRPLATYPRAEPDAQVSGRTELAGGLVAIPTPGHTAGHLSVWAPEHEALFVGDTIWNLGPLRPSWKGFTQDLDANADSVKVLAAENARRAFFGHGRAIAGDVQARFRRLVGR